MLSSRCCRRTRMRHPRMSAGVAAVSAGRQNQHMISIAIWRPYQMKQTIKTCTAVALMCAASWSAAQTGPAAPAMEGLTPEQQRFHDIYKELVEINTTNSVGNNTEAARAMQKHLLDAGF